MSNELKELLLNSGATIVEIDESNWSHRYTETDAEGNMWAVNVYIVDGQTYKTYHLLKGVSRHCPN